MEETYNSLNIYENNQFVELKMKIKQEALFQKPSTGTSVLLNNSKLSENEHFNILKIPVVEIKTEIDDPIQPKIETIEGSNISVESENFEQASNNNDQLKIHSQIFQHRNMQTICPICRKSFSSSGKRKKHFLSHFYLPSSNKRKKKYLGQCLFICLFCGKLCIRKDEISIHCINYKTKILKISNNLQKKSIYCSGGDETISQFSTIKNEIDFDYNNISIKQELQEFVPTQLLKCEGCPREFESTTDLNNHPCHGINHTCVICLKICNSLSSLKRHQRTHSSLKLFKCQFCLKHYKTKESLNTHISLHCKRKFFKCDNCQKRYSSESKFHNHSCNSRSFNCNDCGKHVTDKSRLVSHISTHSQERPHKCEMCPKMFKYPQDLKRHLLFHTGEKPFECNECQKRFRIKQHLTRHMSCHDDQKRFKCEHCPKMFTQKSALVCHVRRHNNDTPFKCDICSKEFTEKKMLDYHILSHTGVKPFQCEVCSKRFKQKQDLKRHSRTHTGEKSVTCAICGKYFTRKQHLNDHLRTHTGDKPYLCSVCPKQFSVRQNLDAHLRKHIKKIPG